MNFPPFNTQFVKVSVGDTVRAGTPYCQTYPGGTALYISEAVISFEVDNLIQGGVHPRLRMFYILSNLSAGSILIDANSKRTLGTWMLLSVVAQ